MKKFLIIFAFPLVLTAGNLLKNAEFNGLAPWKYQKQGIAEEAEFSGRCEKGAFLFCNPQTAGGSGRVRLCQDVVLKPGEQYLFSFLMDTKQASTAWLNLEGEKQVLFSTNIQLGEGKRQYIFQFRVPEKLYSSKAVLTIGAGRTYGITKFSRPLLVPLTEKKIIPFLLSQEWECEISGKRTKIVLTDNRIRFRKNGSERETAVLRNLFFSPNNGYMIIGCSANWEMELSINDGPPVYSTMGRGNKSSRYSVNDHQVYLPVRKGENLLTVKIRSGSSGWEFVCGSSQPNRIFGSRNGYLPISDVTGYVSPGSALDCSTMTQAPLRKRLCADQNGNLIHAEERVPIRLLSFNGELPAPVRDEPYSKTVREYAEAVRRAGYNMMRINAMSSCLSGTERKGERVSPETLNRLHCLAAAFRKEGIYLHLVLLGPGLFGSKQETVANFVRRDALKMRFYLGDPVIREHFLYAVKILKCRNPYTGISLIEDPVIGIIEFYNEQFMSISRIGRVRKNFPEDYNIMLKEWNAYLKNRFGRDFQERDLPEFLAGKKWNREYALFIQTLVEESNLWCKRVLRNAGYPGLCVQNAHKSFVFRRAGWNTMAMQDDHTYFNHPSDTMSIDSRVGAESSLENGIAYLTGLTAGRFHGRPYSIGEIAHCFWNPRQYESGTVWSAYSALQGFSVIAIHEKSISRDKKRIGSFSVAENPIVRAGEFLSAHIFRRGDVRPACREIIYTCSPELWKKLDLWQSPASPNLLKAALVSRVSVEFPRTEFSARFPAGEKSIPRRSITGGSGILDDDWFSQEEVAWKNAEIFRSDTGELRLDIREKSFRISCPKTEVFLSPAEKKDPAPGILHVLNSSADSCTGLVAVDNKPLSVSRRMVLVYTTRAVNSGMELSGDETLLRNPGTLPILLKTGTLDLKIHNNIPNLRFYALDLRGKRTEEIPLRKSGEAYRIVVDTSKLKHGPTVFFELVSEDIQKQPQSSSINPEAKAGGKWETTSSSTI